jgi:predicted RNA binding protein YcfA (HicA-like mRNA interferase family)
MVVKSFNKRQQMKIFTQNGFKTKRTNGSHQILQNSTGQTIIISAHGQKMSDTAFNKTIKQFNLVF